MRAFWTMVGALWLGAVVVGFGMLGRYDNKPGVAATAPQRWPAGSRIARDHDRPTLVMLAHPRCTCTRASIAELAELMARADNRPRAYVVFIKPGGVAANWEKTELWQSAARIPDVTVLRDQYGAETSRFGAETSGQTFLFDAGGQLLYSGGTTGSRGYEGDNAGRATILALLNREGARRASAPVFGCPLFADGDRQDNEAAHASRN